MTITYIDKGPGLQEAITAAGHYLTCTQSLDEDLDPIDLWESDDDVAVQAIIDGYTVQMCRKRKCSEICLFAKEKRDALYTDISKVESSLWQQKHLEAITYTDTQDPLDAPLLSAEATFRGCSLADLCALVIENHCACVEVEAQMSGIHGLHKDALKLLLTFEDILAYDYSAGWDILPQQNMAMHNMQM